MAKFTNFSYTISDSDACDPAAAMCALMILLDNINVTEDWELSYERFEVIKECGYVVDIDDDVEPLH